MSEQLLKDPNTKMTKMLFQQILGNSYEVWEIFEKSLSKYDIAIEWRYYKDGGWLGKGLNKKTIFWASMSEGSFSASFNFLNKPELRDNFDRLDIQANIKKDIIMTPTGKYLGLTMNISKKEQLSDLYKMIDFKKSIK